MRTQKLNVRQFDFGDFFFNLKDKSSKTAFYQTILNLFSERSIISKSTFFINVDAY